MLLSESRSDVETFVAAFGAMPIYAERSCIALRLSWGFHLRLSECIRRYHTRGTLIRLCARM